MHLNVCRNLPHKLDAHWQLQTDRKGADILYCTYAVKERTTRGWHRRLSKWASSLTSGRGDCGREYLHYEAEKGQQLLQFFLQSSCAQIFATATQTHPTHDTANSVSLCSWAVRRATAAKIQLEGT